MKKANEEDKFFICFGEVGGLNSKFKSPTDILVEKLYNLEYNIVQSPVKDKENERAEFIDSVNKTISFPEGYNYNTLQRAYKNCDLKNVRSKRDLESRFFEGFKVNMPDDHERMILAKRIADAISLDENPEKTNFNYQVEIIKEFPKNFNKLETIFNAYQIMKDKLEAIGTDKEGDSFIRSLAYKKSIETLLPLYNREVEIEKLVPLNNLNSD
jgi:hypothetical protein